MIDTHITLVTNPGSSSRKYALYSDDEFLAALHFEFEDDKIICTIKSPDGSKKIIPCDFKELASAVAHIEEILTEEGYITERYPIDVIVARIVAPSDYFTADHLVDDDFMARLNEIKERAPLHTPIIATEIEHLRSSFKNTPIIAVSDSAFHWTKPNLMKYYPFDTDVADKYEIKRYGYHGLSVESIVNTMKSADILPEKLIVCHIGSGSSISAVLGGQSLDCSMGYSPLEGLMMATRSGSMDVAAALALGRALKLDNEALERYLNKKAGLLGVAGNDDFRIVIRQRDEGDPKSTFAHALYIYRIHSCIGHMAASLAGVDAITFTATVLERDPEVRHFIAQKLAYLGFEIDPEKNTNLDPTANITNIAKEGSKPVYVIKTDEAREMARHARKYLESIDKA